MKIRTFLRKLFKESKIQLIHENNKLNKKLNTAENKVEALEDVIKEGLYKNFGIDNQKDETIESLKKQVKKLKNKIEVLQEMIVNESSRTTKRVRETKTKNHNARK